MGRNWRKAGKTKKSADIDKIVEVHGELIDYFDDTVMWGNRVLIQKRDEEMLANHQNITVDALLSTYAGHVICVAAFLLLLSVFLFLHFRRRHRHKRRWRTIDAELEAIDQMEGHDFEFWCADLLEDLGFEKVTVTPGSGDQGVDITAEKEDVKFAFQCKCYQSDLGNTPIQEIFTGKAIYKCHVGVVMTNSYFTKSALSAADATGILLWDRDKIADLIASRTQE